MLGLKLSLQFMLSGAILKKTRLISRNESFRHIAVLFSGRAGVYLISLISQPILARLYTPAQFGEFALLNSILAITVIGASGRYEAGLIFTRKKGHAKRLFQLAQLILIGYVIALCILIFFLPTTFLSYFIEKGLSEIYLWFIPLLVLFSGYWQIVHNWLVRFQKYSRISLMLIIQRLIIFVGALGFAFLPVQGNGLIISILFGLTFLFVFSIFSHREPLKASLKGLGTYARHFRNFPIFTTPALFISLIIQHLPVFWLAHFFNNDITGAFSMAFTLLMLPLTSLILIISQVYHERLPGCTPEKQLEIIKKLFFSYSLILVPISLGLFLWAEQGITFFLGVEWQHAGYIISLLSPVLLFQGLSNCLLLPIGIFQKQYLSLLFQALKLIFWAVSLGAGYYFENAFLSFKLMSLFSFLHFLVIVKVMWPIIINKLSEKPSLSHST